MILAPPIEPNPAECCNRGCCPCIFDYYHDALERWKAVVEARGDDPESKARNPGA
ncbi:MAG TPA: oxidoreductase-like domain-containing protein [Caulobacteraceae bacterium]|jgi:hypothetical protein|nr:oxidoreductase-like domain-containing protein [Caulobacteraceae bacterium]